MLARYKSYLPEKSYKNALIALFYEERLKRLLDLTNLKDKENTRIVLDLGCGNGHFSSILSQRSTTIGVDVTKSFKEKGNSTKLDFIIADVCFLPFKNNSADVIVCASVLEHMRELNSITNEIKRLLKKNAVFVAGYPVETRLFKFVWKIVSPWSFSFIDQSQEYWINPHTGKQECYLESPHTHKQDYKSIRRALNNHFQVLQREKLPSNALPDSATYYECAKCRIK